MKLEPFSNGLSTAMTMRRARYELESTSTHFFDFFKAFSKYVLVVHPDLERTAEAFGKSCRLPASLPAPVPAACARSTDGLKSPTVATGVEAVATSAPTVATVPGASMMASRYSNAGAYNTAATAPTQSRAASSVDSSGAPKGGLGSSKYAR